MSALRWGEVTAETSIEQLTAAAATTPPATAPSTNTDAVAASNAAAASSPQHNSAQAAVQPSPPAPTALPTAAPASSPPPPSDSVLPTDNPSAASAAGGSVDGGPGSGASDRDPLSSLSASLSQAGVSAPAGAEEPRDEEDPLPILYQPHGLNPGDHKAEVEVKNAGDSIYKAVASFEQLGLSPELLAGVYELKFTQPSKIQAQALPVILAGKTNNQPGPNLIGQAHHGSGKTATFSLGLLSLVDPSLAQPQAVVVVPTRELALQVASVIASLAKHTSIRVYTAVPDASGERRDVAKLKAERVTEQVVVGTPGKLESKLKFRNIDSRHVKVFVADEADQMVAQEAFANTTINIKKLLPRTVQILLFSATFDTAIRNFARVVAPNAVEIAVKTEELSLDSIKQFFINCRSDGEKYSTLTSMYGLLEIGQSIIFVHTVATAKLLANRMRGDGYTVSLLHGKDMLPAERDRVMEDFRAQKTTVLITTNVLARGIDVLSVTLVVNFDVPLNKYNKPDPETYIHRIGRSGRFGRKGVAINFVQDDKSRADLAAIANHFQHDITELPTNDMDKLSSIVQQALK